MILIVQLVAKADTQRNLRYLWGTVMASLIDLLDGISSRSLPVGFSKEIIILVDESSFAIKSASVSTRNISNRFLVLRSSFWGNFFVRRVFVIAQPVLLMNILPRLLGWSVVRFVRGIKNDALRAHLHHVGTVMLMRECRLHFFTSRSIVGRGSCSSIFG